MTKWRSISVCILAVLLLVAWAPALAVEEVTVSESYSLLSDRIISDGIYSVRLYDNVSRCLNVQYASKSAGSSRLCVDIYNDESNEQFKVVNRGLGYITLSPLHAPSLYVCAPDKNAGSQLTLKKYTLLTQRYCQWYPICQSDGSFTLRNRATGYVMDLTNGDYTTGNKFISWSANGYARAQAFFMYRYLYSTPNENCLKLSTGYYKITLYADRSKCMNVQFASTEEDNARLCVDSYNGEHNEIFYIAARDNGYVSIHPANCTRLCINALGAQRRPGGKLTLHRYESGDAASLWAPVVAYNGSVFFRNKATGLVMDLRNGNYTVGNDFLCFAENGYERAQSLYVTKVSDPRAPQKEAQLVGRWEYPLSNHTMTQDFSHYYSYKGADHLGIDIISDDYTVRAAADGVVRYADYNSANGNCVVIQHQLSGRTVYSFYAHMSSLSVSAGKSVSVGTKIGVMGSTGSSNGAHVHFAVTDTYRAGSYYGYSYDLPTFSNSATSVRSKGITFYDPDYIVLNDRLP